MHLHQLAIEGFRSFGEATTITFDDVTAFIGANNTGKTAALSALAKHTTEHPTLMRIPQKLLIHSEAYHRAFSYLQPILLARWVFPSASNHVLVRASPSETGETPSSMQMDP